MSGSFVHSCVLIISLIVVRCAADLTVLSDNDYGKEESPPDFMVATDQGIYNVILEHPDDGSTYTGMLIKFRNITDISYDQEKHVFVFEANERFLYTSKFNSSTGDYSEPAVIVEEHHELKGHSLDSVHDLVYYFSYSRNSSQGDKMWRSSLDGKDRTPYNLTFERISSEYRSSVDPSTGWIFYKEGRKAYGYDLVNGKGISYTTKKTKIDFLVADRAKGRLYILASERVGRKGPISYYMDSVEFDGSGRQEVYRGDELKDAIAMDVLDNQVAWTGSYAEDTFYYCRLTPTCRTENLKIYKREFARWTLAIRFYQRGMRQWRCGRSCSHFCRDNRCVCPVGEGLQEDLMNCGPGRTDRTTPDTTTSTTTTEVTTTDDTTKFDWDKYCVESKHCPDGRECVDSRCQHPCTRMCGHNAECMAVGQLEVCFCKPGFLGKPDVECFVQDPDRVKNGSLIVCEGSNCITIESGMPDEDDQLWGTNRHGGTFYLPAGEEE